MYRNAIPESGTVAKLIPVALIVGAMRSHNSAQGLRRPLCLTFTCCWVQISGILRSV